jgi:hypothetical protein
MISGGNQSPTSFSLFNQTQFLRLLFYIANLFLNIIYQSLWDRSCTYTLYYTFDLVHLQVKRTKYYLLIYVVFGTTSFWHRCRGLR